ncbi:unnamed protein product [Leptidea sinapis]|uniref:Uncharacterized protein n=1 Tax=Leptidea sinapis TaxID=189913 RepID=A0A5E4QYT2_9NEOP|nr:unnamed protein product [Leptidea sinapis]
MKLSFMTAERMPFQVSLFSSSSVQIDSSAILTTGGGFDMERTSTNCCFLMDLTAAFIMLYALLLLFMFVPMRDFSASPRPARPSPRSSRDPRSSEVVAPQGRPASPSTTSPFVG